MKILDCNIDSIANDFSILFYGVPYKYISV